MIAILLVHLSLVQCPPIGAATTPCNNNNNNNNHHHRFYCHCQTSCHTYTARCHAGNTAQQQITQNDRHRSKGDQLSNLLLWSALDFSSWVKDNRSLHWEHLLGNCCTLHPRANDIWQFKMSTVAADMLSSELLVFEYRFWTVFR